MREGEHKPLIRGTESRETGGLLARLRKRLPQGAFARNVAVLAGGTALAQAVTVLVSPLLTRLYNPAEFGTYMVYTSVLSVLVVLASLLYDQAVPLPEEERTAAHLLVLALGGVLSMSVLVTLAVWLFGAPLVRWAQADAWASWLWVLPFGVLGGGTYLALSSWAVRRQRFGVLATTKWQQSGTLVGGQLGLGWLGAGTFGLLFGDVLGRVAGSGTLLRQVVRADAALLRSVTRAELWAVARRYRRFPLLTGPSTLLNLLGLQLPVLLLAGLYGPLIVGLYALAQRVLGMPVQVLATSVAEVYMAELARVRHTAPERMRPLFLRTCRNMLLLGLPFAGVLVLLAPAAFGWVFGSDWTEAGRYVQVLAVVFVCQLVANAVSPTVIVLERQGLHVIRELVRIGLLLGALAVAAGGALSPLAAVAWLAAASALAYLVYIGLAWFAIDQENKVGTTEEGA